LTCIKALPDSIRHSVTYLSAQAEVRNMITTSEITVTITIWVLTASGTFFGTRAVWRRRKKKAQEQQKP
jgi:hypothetical protein